MCFQLRHGISQLTSSGLKGGAASYIMETLTLAQVGQMILLLALHGALVKGTGQHCPTTTVILLLISGHTTTQVGPFGQCLLAALTQWTQPTLVQAACMPPELTHLDVKGSILTLMAML